jgi:hypothetical protein
MRTSNYGEEFKRDAVQQIEADDLRPPLRYSWTNGVGTAQVSCLFLDANLRRARQQTMVQPKRGAETNAR